MRFAGAGAWVIKCTVFVFVCMFVFFVCVCVRVLARVLIELLKNACTIVAKCRGGLTAVRSGSPGT